MKDKPSESELKKLRMVFDEVIDLPVEEREAFIDNSFNEDTHLRERLLAMVKAYENTESGFEPVWKEAVWPALRSLNENISQIESLLEPVTEEETIVDDSLIGKDVSHFHIMESIGRGGMGMVYKAHDENLDRYVALKFLPPSVGADPSSKKRFIKEAKTASALDHSNIATVHEIGETDDHQMYIAMAYYEGQSLKDLIEQEPLQKNQAIDHAIQLADALNKAHLNGVVHRDIKCDNILITEEGVVKLLDFGLAKLTFESGYTQVGELMGTVAYMSPEQARGDEVDHRTDIWSFGIVLYEMLTGQRPFDGDNLQHTIHSILNDEPFDGSKTKTTKASIPKPLRTIIEVCLTKDPADRYQSAADLERDLKRVADGLAPLARLNRFKRALRIEKQKVLAAVLIFATILTTWMITKNRQDVSEKGITFTRVSGGELAEHTGGFAGAYWGDYDADGLMDFFTGGLTPMLFRNQGEGNFSRVVDSGIGNDLTAPATSPRSAQWFDFENDGDLDIYITYFNNSGEHLHRFFLNNGDGTFERAKYDWIPSKASLAAAWGDIDNDGLLDVFIGRNEKNTAPDKLIYHHQTDGSMVPLILPLKRSFGSVWSDFDMDGDVDLITVADPCFIYRNEGDFSFTPMTPDILPGVPMWLGLGSYNVACGDYDNDGDFDLVVSDQTNHRFYRNDLEAGFVELKDNPITRDSGHGSCLWGDYDNDGFLDLMITRRLLFHNEGDGTFTKVIDIPLQTEEGGASGGSFADYDNDGDLDILLGNGIRTGAIMTDPPQNMRLYRNEGNSNNWITMTLVGVRSNRSAIGSKVFLYATINGEPIQQLREVTCGGRNQSDPRVHFGLGDAKDVESIRIEWPSGAVDEYRDLSPNQFLTFVEGNSSGSRF
jgi:serine/threonine protein kinase